MIKAYLEQFPSNLAGLREINKACNSNYSNSRMYDWINGKYRIPKEVCDFIRGRILYEVLSSYRVIKPSDIDEINDKLKG